MDIGVVLVTFNRLNCLTKALDKYEIQKKKPKYIIVVNNCSNDGTEAFLKEWKNEKSEIEKYVINLKENTGGSGGFCFLGLSPKPLTASTLNMLTLFNGQNYQHTGIKKNNRSDDTIDCYFKKNTLDKHRKRGCRRQTYCSERCA